MPIPFLDYGDRNRRSLDYDRARNRGMRIVLGMSLEMATSWVVHEHEMREKSFSGTHSEYRVLSIEYRVCTRKRKMKNEKIDQKTPDLCCYGTFYERY